MKYIKTRNIAIAMFLISVVFIAPNIRFVVAISDDAVIEDITHDDIGIEGHYTFANVTYNTDGTGSDVLDSSNAGLGASLESFTGQESWNGRLHTGIGRGIFAPNGGSGAGISAGETLWTYEDLEQKFNSGGSGAGISVTNETTSEELFAYDQKERYGTGGHDFASDFDSDTTWYDANCSTAANAFNISSEYEALNESLTEADGLDIDDFFNNAGDNAESKTSFGYWDSHTQGETFVVGYEDAEEGIINDLRAYLALENSKDFSDIVITSYNITTAQFSYNMSEHLTGQIRKVVDYALDEAGSGSSALWLTAFGLPLLSIGSIATSPVKLGGSGSSISWDPLGAIGSALNKIGTSVKSGFVSFGTRLRQFGSTATNWVGQRIQDTQRTADKAFHTVGGTIKSALSGGYKALQSGANHIVNVGKGIIKTGQTIVQKAVHCVTGFATGIIKMLTSPIFIIVMLVVVCIVGYVVLKKTDKI